MADLERKLRSAAERIHWPDADLRGAVTSAIGARQPGPRRRWLQLAAAAAAVTLLVLATPAGRQAVADILEVAGIRVGWGDAASAPGAGLELGEEMSLEEAADLVDHPLLHPTEIPDAVYYEELADTDAIHMVWAGEDDLPAAGDTGIGLLYTQLRAGTSKLFLKSLSPDTEARPVTVRGQQGLWIEGAPHVILYEDESGLREERARLAANVLAWEEGGVTHRIETTLGLEETLGLAGALQPVP